MRYAAPNRPRWWRCARCQGLATRRWSATGGKFWRRCSASRAANEPRNDEHGTAAQPREDTVPLLAGESQLPRDSAGSGGPSHEEKRGAASGFAAGLTLGWINPPEHTTFIVREPQGTKAEAD